MHTENQSNLTEISSNAKYEKKKKENKYIKESTRMRLFCISWGEDMLGHEESSSENNEEVICEEGKNLLENIHADRH